MPSVKISNGFPCLNEGTRRAGCLIFAAINHLIEICKSTKESEMKKFMSSILMISSLIFIAMPSYAATLHKTGQLTSFFTDGTSSFIIVDGLFYYCNFFSPCNGTVITSIDLARRINNGIVNFYTNDSRQILGAD